MYCSKCGNKVNENDKFCTKCGNACIEQERTFNNENINQFNTSNSTNSMALPSLICSIVGLFVFGIPLGIISLILGIMDKIEEWNEEQKKVFKEKQFQKQKKELKK